MGWNHKDMVCVNVYDWDSEAYQVSDGDVAELKGLQWMISFALPFGQHGNRLSLGNPPFADDLPFQSREFQGFFPLPQNLDSQHKFRPMSFSP